MPDTEGLRNALQNQKEALEALESQVRVVLDSDSVRENEILKKDLSRFSSDINGLKEKLAIATAENSRLKNALHDQIYSERMSIIQKAMDKNSVYFKNKLNAEENKLDAIERDIRKKISEMEESLKKYRAENFEVLYKKLYALSGEVSEAVYDARVNAEREKENLSDYSMAEFARIKDEEIQEDVYDEIGRKSNFEVFIGGNVINKVGVALVIIGVIALSRFTFTRLPDIVKAIVMFAISAGMLAAGEFLNRKKPNVFSIGITSGGIACMFLSLAYSYFMLNVLSMYVAIFLCVLISAGAFVLSRRYESPTVATFALIGGYLPISTISGDTATLYAALIYFVILNLFALGISTLSMWVVPMFIGFFLNLCASAYLILLVIDSSLPYRNVAAIAYALFAFAVYTAIPIMGNLRKKRDFSTADVILMGLNTFFSSLMMYGVFLALYLDSYMGLLALIFAVTYILLGVFAEKCLSGERRMTILFYLTGLTFVVLMVPLQFGVKWLAIGWLVEAVLLSVYGILTEDKKFKNPGFVIYGLCIFAFIFFDVVMQGDMFFFKYMGVTFGSVVILAALCHKKVIGTFVSFFKITVLVNFWWYLLYLIVKLVENIVESKEYSALRLDFLIFAAMIAVTLLLSFVYPEIPRIKDKAVKILSVVMAVVSLVIFLILNGMGSLINYGRYPEAPFAITAMAVSVLVVLCILALLGLKNVVLFFIVEKNSLADAVSESKHGKNSATVGRVWSEFLPSFKRKRYELLPVSLSFYFMFILTQSLVEQFGISVTNAAISLIFIVAAVGWVAFGFARRYVFMRRFGLGFALLAVAKLFMIDLNFLTQGFKIVSYFAFGAALLGISYIYQYFSKRLLAGGIKDGEVEDEKTA